MPPSMAHAGESAEAAQKRSQRKLRSACDNCHQTKVKCTGGNPCSTCKSLDLPCQYSVSNRTGRPRGTKNKKTIERQRREAELAKAQKAQAERAEAYHFHESMMGHIDPRHPMPIITNGIPPQCLRTPGEALDFGGDFAQFPDMSPLAMPGGACPMMGTAELPWSAVSETQPTGWIPEDIQMNAAQVQSPMTDMFDLPLMQAWSLQSPTTPSFYGPGSKYAQSRPSPEQPNNLQQASPPYSYEEAPPSLLSSPSQSNFVDMMASGSAPCHCLQLQADVLCRFKKFVADPAPRIDVLLLHAKQGISAWDKLLKCDHCRHSQDQAALLLCSMSIKTWMQSLQLLDLNVLQSDVNIGADLYTAQGRPRGGSIDSNMSNISGPAMSRVDSSHSQFTEADAISMAAPHVGVYELHGSERSMVAKILLANALSKIRSLLGKFRQQMEWREQQQQVQNRLDQGMQDMTFNAGLVENGASDGDESTHLLGTLRFLENAVQDFRRKLRAWSPQTQP